MYVHVAPRCPVFVQGNTRNRIEYFIEPIVGPQGAKSIQIRSHNVTCLVIREYSWIAVSGQPYIHIAIPFQE